MVACSLVEDEERLPHESSSRTLLQDRLAALPGHLREVGERVTVATPPTRPAIVTGVGGSEGPARMMAELLRTHSHASASFVPLSAFATDSIATQGMALTVFSQSLSPNARLALARAPELDEATLFTSVAHDPLLARFEAHGGRLVRLPPATEQGALVRVIGPCVAMLAAALQSGAASPPHVVALLEAMHGRALVPDVDCSGRVAFVTAGGYGELCRTVKNVWLEALCVPEPPMWDVLEVAHGPFQQFFDSDIVLLALERVGDESLLFDRLEQMLVPGRHTLVRLRSSVARPVAPIDHVSRVVELACRELARCPRDLGEWPGRGLDGPIYGLEPGWRLAEVDGQRRRGW
jgi:hypothetical protein